MNSHVLNTLGVAYKNIGDSINAKLYLEKSIKISPENFQVHRNLSSLIDYKDDRIDSTFKIGHNKFISETFLPKFYQIPNN